MRKPVSSSVLGSLLLVVCDDGSVWELDPTGEWMERRPVPGTRAHLAEAERPADVDRTGPERTPDGERG
jgi:hypothetical protein